MLGRRDRDKILIYLCLYQIQLRKLVVKIHSSPQCRECFQQQLVAAKLPLLELIPLRHVGIRQNWWSRGLWNSGRFVSVLLIYLAFWELDFLFASRRLFIILHPRTETLKNMCYQMMSGIVLKKYTSYCRYVVSINNYLIQLLTMLFFIV